VTRQDLINRIASTMQEDTSTKPFEALEDFEQDNLRDWAKSALAAIEEAGCKVVPAEPLPEAVGAWYRVKNGFHFQDEPEPTDTSDDAAYRAMICIAAI
jgi:hypothetical protein